MTGTGESAPGCPPEPERMCPSTPASNATVFLGMITPAGRVAYVTPAMPAGVVLGTADAGGAGTGAGPAGSLESGSLESRYRFAGPCVTSSCGFWTGEHCGLGARLVESYREVQATNPDGVRAELPKCAIRRTCRWFAEQGAAACSPCSYVSTDVKPTAGASRS